jgi:sarcosine oxidase subunit alpha
MHEWHVAHGAKMMNAGLWKRPEHYSNPTAEVLATRTSLGLIDVGTLGKLLIRGKDVPALLERLYTNKWSGLAVGRARYGLMCNEEGIVSDDGVATHLNDDTWYITTTTGGPTQSRDIEWDRNPAGGKVHVVNMTDTYTAMNDRPPCSNRAPTPHRH